MREAARVYTCCYMLEIFLAVKYMIARYLDGVLRHMISDWGQTRECAIDQGAIVYSPGE